jgi:hypothetical protein
LVLRHENAILRRQHPNRAWTGPPCRAAAMPRACRVSQARCRPGSFGRGGPRR